MLDFQRHRQMRFSGVNITSLIDVLFLLLLFFMLTNNYLSSQAIDLTVSTGAVATASDEKPVVLVVGDRGRVFWNNQIVEAPQLEQQLAAVLQDNTDRQIVIYSAGPATVQDLVTTMDTVKRIGGTKISLLQGDN